MEHIKEIIPRTRMAKLGAARTINIHQKEVISVALESFVKALEENDVKTAQKTTLWLMDVLFDSDTTYRVNRGWL